MRLLSAWLSNSRNHVEIFKCCVISSPLGAANRFRGQRSCRRRKISFKPSVLIVKKQREMELGCLSNEGQHQTGISSDLNKLLGSSPMSLLRRGNKKWTLSVAAQDEGNALRETSESWSSSGTCRFCFVSLTSWPALWLQPWFQPLNWFYRWLHPTTPRQQYMRWCRGWLPPCSIPAILLSCRPRTVSVDAQISKIKTSEVAGGSIYVWADLRAQEVQRWRRNLFWGTQILVVSPPRGRPLVNRHARADVDHMTMHASMCRSAMRQGTRLASNTFMNNSNAWQHETDIPWWISGSGGMEGQAAHQDRCVR